LRWNKKYFLKIAFLEKKSLKIYYFVALLETIITFNKLLLGLWNRLQRRALLIYIQQTNSPIRLLHSRSKKSNFSSVRFVAWGNLDKRSIFRVATKRPAKGELQNLAHLPGPGWDFCLNARVCIAYVLGPERERVREREWQCASDWSRCSLLTARN
jgi:hypothetical protein